MNQDQENPPRQKPETHPSGEEKKPREHQSQEPTPDLSVKAPEFVFMANRKTSDRE